MPSFLCLLLVLLTSSAASSSWDGVFYDPDELKITIRRTGASIVAKSDDWDISGTLISESKARLAGLEGTLGEAGVSWSNGVVWSKQESAAPLEPPTWKGLWHGKVNDNDVSVWKTSPTRIVAEGYRNGKKWKAEGHVSGDQIYLFGISGRVRSGYSADDAVIDWSNKEIWTKVPPAPKAASSPPPPPLLAAGAKGALPDYWAADFKASATAAATGGGGAPYADRTHLSAGGGGGAYGEDLSIHTGAGGGEGGGGGDATPADAMRGAYMQDGEDDDEEEEEDSFPYDSQYATGQGAFYSTSSSAGDGGYGGMGAALSSLEATKPRGSAGGGSAGDGLDSVLMLLVALVLLGAVGGGVASYRRHGALEKQLLLDDSNELLAACRTALGADGGSATRGTPRGMQRVQASEEDAEGSEANDEDEARGDGSGGGGGLLGWLRAHGSKAAGAARSAFEQAAGAVSRGLSVPEVVSASDDTPAERGKYLGGDADDDDAMDEEQAPPPSRAHKGKRGGGDRAAKSRGGGRGSGSDRDGGTGGRHDSGYDWGDEGEKLSWEVGAGERPDELPEIRKYIHRMPGHLGEEQEGEEGEEVC